MIQFGYLIHFGLIATVGLYFGALTVLWLRSLRSQPIKIHNHYSSKSVENLRLYRRNLLNQRFN